MKRFQQAFTILGLLVALLLFTTTIGIDASEKVKLLPEKFLGSWDVDHSENFDEYLEAKGYGWIMRQVVKIASITKTFTAKGGGLYNCKIDTSKKNVEWDNWRLDVPFEGEYLDDAQHKITFSYDPAKDVLSEKHELVAEPDKKPDIYTYQVEDDGSAKWLVMKMEYGGVATKRFYKKTTD